MFFNKYTNKCEKKCSKKYAKDGLTILLAENADRD